MINKHSEDDVNIEDLVSLVRDLMEEVEGSYKRERMVHFAFMFFGLCVMSISIIGLIFSI